MATKEAKPQHDRKAVWGRKFGGMSGLAAVRAKGREREPGQQNKLEAEYEKHLQLLLATDQIAWYCYDSIKLRLADGSFLSPDFFVMLPSGEIQAHDTKGGFIEEDAKVKMRVATSRYPFPLFYVQKVPKKDGGGWKLTEV